MKWVGILVAGCVGCTPGDNIGAPRLQPRAENLVPVAELRFDADNQPLGLLSTDHGKRLARLRSDRWERVDTATAYNVVDLGEASDGTTLLTIGDLPPGSGVFELGSGDELHQLGGRLTTALSFGPYQSPTGDLYVSTVDGGRRLASGDDTWMIAKALTQVVRTPDAVYGMSGAGLERLDIEDRDGIGTLLLPCAAMPGACASIHFDGRDDGDRMYFHADGRPELWVLEPGASELTPMQIGGAKELGSVFATPSYVVVETIADDHSSLYVLPAGGDTFTLINKAANPALTRPLVAIDREGTVYLAHGAWLGTLQLE